MKKEIKEKFLTALRSGEYEQTKGRLKNGNCFCALGVLCDLFIKEHKFAEWEEDSITVFPDSIKQEIFSYQTPRQVDEWAEFSEDTAIYDKQGVLSSIIELNDDYGYTFEEIAELIEKQL